MKVVVFAVLLKPEDRQPINRYLFLDWAIKPNFVVSAAITFPTIDDAKDFMRNRAHKVAADDAEYIRMMAEIEQSSSVHYGGVRFQITSENLYKNEDNNR